MFRADVHWLKARFCCPKIAPTLVSLAALWKLPQRRAKLEFPDYTRL